MSRAVLPLAIVGAIILGLAFAIFPISGVAETWAEQNSTSTAGTYQLVALVAVGMAALALLLMGSAQRFPFPPFGFIVAMVALAAVAWFGIGMVLGG
jgi:hypothetical protein